MGHASIQITADVYGHLVPGGNREAVDRLDDLRTVSNAGTESIATHLQIAKGARPRKSAWPRFAWKNGEPRRNRTFNPQIKSLLLCQLS
jgi:hypothetical protein